MSVNCVRYLSAEERLRIDHLIGELGISTQCTQCGLGLVRVQPECVDLSTISSAADGAAQIGVLSNGSTTCLMTVCSRCGHSCLYNMRVLGLLP